MSTAKSTAKSNTLRRLVRRWWYTARVENHAGVHGVFYSTTRPTIGAACPGIAGPNRVVGYRRELAPNAEVRIER